MARRKSALLFLLLLLTLLLLLPWASAPSPTSPAVREPDDGPAPAAAPVVRKEPVRIRVAAALSEEEFRFLQQQSEESDYRHPDTVVELTRVDPDSAYQQFRSESKMGDAPDVMLVENEWVKQFAASGYLMPVDGAFVGEALAEQFDALSAAVKWNDYVWAVPRDFDPYVLVWNLSVLRTLLGDTAAVPQGPAQWALLAEKSRSSGQGISWLTLDRGDAGSWLAWLETVTHQRTDTLWTEGPGIWRGTARLQAMTLLDQERAGVFYAADHAAASAQIAGGKSAAALLPYSEALQVTSGKTDPKAGGIVMDFSAWKLPYHGPRGRSYVVSSRTQAEDAALAWIAIMTETARQHANETAFGKLPVYRSSYGPGSVRAAPLSEASAGMFPYVAPEDDGPHIPDRLTALSRLWSDWSGGRLKLEDWIRRWPETSTQFQLND